eukprot:1884-Chlamydomonas_euryale.AAC.2
MLGFTRDARTAKFDAPRNVCPQERRYSSARPPWAGGHPVTGAATGTVMTGAVAAAGIPGSR